MWMPGTPVKRPGNVVSDMPEIQVGEEDWCNLLGVYSDVLQNDIPNAVFGSNNNVSQSRNETNSRISHGALAVQHNVPGNSDQMGYTGLGSVRHESNQGLGILQNCKRQNVGVVSFGKIPPHQKVKSLAELMKLSDAKPGPMSNGVAIVRSDGIGSYNQTSRSFVGSEQHQGMNRNAQYGNYHLQEISNIGRNSISYPSNNYDLNMVPSVGGETSTAIASQPFEPATTDVQRQPKNGTQVPQWRYIQENHKQNNAFSTEQTQNLEQHDEILENGIGSTTAESTSDEKINLYGGTEGIDLNKTPQQKTPKRKKYLPKVVVEGKPKKTPKSATAQSNIHGENSPAKRSYVRKNGINTSSPGTGDVEASDIEPAKRSCRRSLNFDLDESVARQGREKLKIQAENTNGSKYPFNLTEVQKTYGPEIKQVPTSFAPSTSKMSVHDLGSIAQQLTVRDHHTSTTRSFSMQNVFINQYGGNSTNNQVDRGFSKDLTLLPLQANADKEILRNQRRPWLQSTIQNQKDFLNSIDIQCLKRSYASNEMRQPQTTGIVGPGVVLHGVPEVCRYNSTYNNTWQHSSEVSKKRHADNNYHGTYSNHLEYLLRTERQLSNKLHAHSSLVHNNDGLNSYYNSSKIVQDSLQRHFTLSQELSAERMRQKMLQQIFFARNINPGEFTRRNNESTSQKGTKHITTVSSPDCVAVKKRTAGKTSSKKVSIDTIQWKSSIDNKSHVSSSKHTGLKKLTKAFTINDLIDHLKHLKIIDKDSKTFQKDQYAIVPYSADGAIVPHEKFDPGKRKFPRPKVDLDQETNRLWNLLMSNEGSECAEAMDKDKQKWWEDERKVFRGRIDTFISRMHQVQGDRRFSKWKGSVVDSVVGVFLTQNVSDHLSSSAFMCLAAKFPPKNKNTCNSWRAAHNNNIHITYPDETDHKVIGDSIYNHSSVTTEELLEYKDEHARIPKEFFSTNGYILRTEDDVVSSQSSSGSLTFQTSKYIRSSSGSNSEAEERCIASRDLVFEAKGSSNKNMEPLTYVNHQLEGTVYMQNTGHASSRHEFVNPTTSNVSHDLSAFFQPADTWNYTPIKAGFPSYSERHSLSSLTSENFEGRDGPSVEGPNSNQVLPMDGTCPAIGNEIPEFSSLQVDYGPQKSLNYISDEKDILLRKPEKQQERHQEETIFLSNPIERTATENCKSRGSIIYEPVRETVLTEDRQAYLPRRQPNKDDSTASNATKQKTEKKASIFDWDTLRKQAELKYGAKDRSWEAMDSLDYDAVRNADVHEISETIKERGMNNMLAERIKDFLDRLVQDHGRTDLEWLRDVPPDKAKEYLLSIRGLGLKSVECVRLLTLHHLAFPVDTNVGRIAVRLGWVPLQPLPESLQLHLLELYPVLESIQKYLWPRLCKLDQETLYELHYQMITFGKVFCTKRDPNCNACPVKGDCRHFASAFASARLALPGPQERQIVHSFSSIGTSKNFEHRPKPMMLPSSVDNIEQKYSTPRTCEPVIEEPMTPELPTADLEQDIEDAFYDDTDEIPVIELNVKEFTTNLQSFIQENMEIAEDDMSKALVALNPEVAYLPVPKLKHISRLRTEHQVYELPDAHPLLEGMDKREADDPSPYLLAIWSPGETADMFQPPEQICRFQEQGELCFDKTCFSCNSKREAQALIRGTILIPCRTAMRGSFPLNGTYFQVNEVFADHESSLKPIDVPRSLIWKLPRRTVFFGSSVTSIFKGLSTENIQYCFWKGFVCVRGFDQKLRAPRPLMARLHFSASKMAKKND